MIVTEEEAKTKVCCGGDGCGRLVYDGGMYRRDCLGSACMAWRVSSDEAAIQAGFIESELDGKIVGYCGKAGRP